MKKAQEYLIIRVPEMTVPNTVVEHPVLIDLYPIFKLAGIDLETRKQKRSWTRRYFVPF